MRKGAFVMWVDWDEHEGRGGWEGRYSNMHTLSLKASFLLVKTSSFDYAIILSSNHTVGIRSLVWTCRDQTTWNVWLNETKHQAGCFRWRLSTDTVKSLIHTLVFWIFTYPNTQIMIFIDICSALDGKCSTYCIQMWQSWVEIEHYSISHFDRITTFEAL